MQTTLSDKNLNQLEPNDSPAVVFGELQSAEFKPSGSEILLEGNNKKEGGRNLIICFDGTSNSINNENLTNVAKIYKMLEKTKGDKQIGYYQPGVGINILENSEQFKMHQPQTNIFEQLGGMLDGILQEFTIYNTINAGIGHAIDEYVKGGYKYLVDNYQEGDKIYLFGFSRGSITARILSGIIDLMGLLYSGKNDLFDHIWDFYKDYNDLRESVRACNKLGPMMDSKKTALDSELQKVLDKIAEFKRQHIHEFKKLQVRIEYMGLFDTVNACGAFNDEDFPNSSATGNINHIRHAVSIDEKRVRFRQTLFDPHSFTPSSVAKEILASGPTKEHSFHEVWFPGDHSDVGGSWTLLNPISDISLHWMVRSAVQCGVLFTPDSIKLLDETTSIEKSLFNSIHDSLGENGSISPPSNQDNEQAWQTPHFAITKPVYFGKSTRFWKIIENVPYTYYVENDDNKTWTEVTTTPDPTDGYGTRRIHQGAKFHWSVYWRLRLIKNYRPKNILDRTSSDEYTDLQELNQFLKNSENVEFNLKFGMDTNEGIINEDRSIELDRFSHINWNDVPNDLKGIY